MSRIAYEVVDVFTTTRFGGNQLAVIPDARGLDDALMQHIATEFGYSETTFVLPPADPAHTVKVRIFTPTDEVPFAGHPNVGTGYVLARQGEVFGRPVGDQMIFEEHAGLVGVEIQRRDGAVSGAAITAPRPLEIGPDLPIDLVAACAMLTPQDIAVGVHPPRVLSVGLPFAFAQLTDRATLALARPDIGAFAKLETIAPLSAGRFSLFIYVPTLGQPRHYSARMFAPLDNVMEDAATGSASAALGAYLATLEPQTDGEIALTIEQGVDMGRPSLLELLAHKSGGVVQRISVGGGCVPVMRGELVD